MSGPRPPWPAAAGLRRARLLDLLRRPVRLTLVVAPAGHGKTTLLAQHASRVTAEEPGRAVAWHRATPEDGDPVCLARSLQAALSRAGRPAGGAGPDALAGTLERSGDGLELVLDDVHLLADSEAEAVLEGLLAAGSPGFRAVLGARRPPGLNLARAELGPVAVVGADDLRFRSWEVEELFRDVHGEPLPPDDVAALARRTDGWAACLQLFHLSTQARPLDERRRAVGALTGGARFARTYLARTVLADLPPDLRDFLARTSVLEVLTAARCDRLLGGTGAQAVLDRLERLGVLSSADDAGGGFRSHEVLRRHLETALREQLGTVEADRWSTRAAVVLEEEGAEGEAVRALLRAGRWDRATRLLQRSGRRVIDTGPAPRWDDVLPPELVAEDPWLSTALARRLAAGGRLADAVAHYRRAEELLPDPVDRDRTARERRLVELWTGGTPQPHLSWVDRARAAVAGRPAALPAVRPEEPGDLLAAALAALLLGEAARAGALLRELLGRVAGSPPGPEATPDLLPLAARLLQALVALTAGGTAGDGGGAEEADRVAADAEAAGLGWVVRQARVVRGLRDRDAVGLARLGRECAAAGDPWGALLADGAGAALAVRSGRARAADLAELAARCARLGAGTLAAWAGAAAAARAAAAGEPDATDLALAAEAAGRAAGVWGPVSRRLGVVLPADAGTAGAVAGGLAPPVRLRCLGGFEVEVGGHALDWGAVRPRAAAAFRMLAVHTPHPLHRETLLQLWPGLPPEQAVHSLHVAVSSLRALLAPQAPRGSPRVLERRGESYALVLPPGSTADVPDFDRAADDAQRARRAGSAEEETAALSRAVALYRWYLLPEDGTAEWVVAERDRLRLRATLACGRLAALHLAAGAPEEALVVARRGLAVDAAADGCWRALVAAYDRLGDTAAAALARREYADLLRRLGIPAPRGRLPAR